MARDAHLPVSDPMTLLLPGNDAKLEEAAAYVSNHEHPSAIELQVHFKIRWEQAQNLANVLQERGLWPKCGHRQGLKRVCILFRGHIRGHVFEI